MKKLFGDPEKLIVSESDTIEVQRGRESYSGTAGATILTSSSPCDDKELRIRVCDNESELPRWKS